MLSCYHKAYRIASRRALCERTSRSLFQRSGIQNKKTECRHKIVEASKRDVWHYLPPKFAMGLPPPPYRLGIRRHKR
ncbi:hypothetical protein HOLleu_38796 [Holothuria leucospilota]|uniref:Uncharacterized protein n=1 Tax=Holothuria leucospilota TaxID=206669 RepID=A0A9Q0YJZ8_HOLLE|nr:hypothetical protein HOLleu_38796 [Holothuria leucospilota]